MRYCSSRLHGDRPAQPCNFYYPIDFVVKHPVAPEVNPVPTLGWVRTVRFSALLKGQSPQRLSTLSSSSVKLAKQRKGFAHLVNPCSAPAAPVQTWGTRPDMIPELGGADRDRTGDPLLAKQVLSQLSYSPLTVVVGLGRFELPTSPLSGVRSNQLSYRPAGCARVS